MPQLIIVETLGEKGEALSAEAHHVSDKTEAAILLGEILFQQCSDRYRRDALRQWLETGRASMCDMDPDKEVPDSPWSHYTYKS